MSTAHTPTPAEHELAVELAFSIDSRPFTMFSERVQAALYREARETLGLPEPAAIPAAVPVAS